MEKNGFVLKVTSKDYYNDPLCNTSFGTSPIITLSAMSNSNSEVVQKLIIGVDELIFIAITAVILCFV